MKITMNKLNPKQPTELYLDFIRSIIKYSRSNPKSTKVIVKLSLEDEYAFWKRIPREVITLKLIKPRPRFQVNEKSKYQAVFDPELLIKYYQSLTNFKTPDSAPVEAPVSTPSRQLRFYPNGLTKYGSSEKIFRVGTKAYRLLELLDGIKNHGWEDDDVMRINQRANESHRFKSTDDIRITVGYIRRSLKVEGGEYFPIEKENNKWRWEE